MADPFTQGVSFAANTPATAADQNDAWDNLEDYLNARMGNLTEAQLLIANASGQVVGKTLSGDATVDANGAISVFGGGAPEKLGLSSGGAVRRGKSIIATEQSRSNTAYGVLPTPDLVDAVVLPTDGLIVVAYRATVKSSVAGAGRVALFLNSNQLQADLQGAGLGVQEAAVTTTYVPLSSCGYGLAASGVADTGPVTTGQAVQVHDIGENNPAGGACYIFAAAGTYAVSVRYKASSGSITAKNRKLWVRTEAY